jgi:ABC-type branched-subunit amino acid transport system substrate-binding protein
MQIVLDAIARASETNPGDKAAAREAVRAAGTDPSHQYDTILGTVQFDANGDTNQKIISIYKFDGAGDWQFDTQVDYK